jgi:hypothetical protein
MTSMVLSALTTGFVSASISYGTRERWDEGRDRR